MEVKKILINNQIRIDQRLKHAELRHKVRHWESDLMIGVRQKIAIRTIVEKKLGTHL